MAPQHLEGLPPVKVRFVLLLVLLRPLSGLCVHLHPLLLLCAACEWSARTALASLVACWQLHGLSFFASLVILLLFWLLPQPQAGVDCGQGAQRLAGSTEEVL